MRKLLKSSGSNSLPAEAAAPAPMAAEATPPRPSARRSISDSSYGPQITQLKEQMEQVQLNAIQAQAEVVGQLQSALRQLETATSRLNDLEATLDDTSASPYLKTSTATGAVAVVGVVLYALKTWNSKPVSKLGYSKSLRHIHLLMGVGAIGGIGTVQLARNMEPGPEKKQCMDLHKISGVLMLAGICLRIVLRFRSIIPGRYPGLRPVQFLETLSHRGFYLLMLALPASGVAYSYCSGQSIPILGETKPEIEEEDGQIAEQAINIHKKLGQFLEYGWVPFHFLSMAYHYSKGRSVVKKITPFP